MKFTKLLILSSIFISSFALAEPAGIQFSSINNFNAPEEMLKKWDIEYFKGLATTSNSAVFDIFTNISKRFLTTSSLEAFWL